MGGSTGCLAFLLAALEFFALYAQSPSVPVMTRDFGNQRLSAAQTQKAKSVADEVTREIQGIRVLNHLPPLHRSKTNRQLLEETCTAAMTDKDFPSPNLSDGQFFRISNGAFSIQGQTIIDRDSTWNGLQRFEIAAWPVTGSPSAQQIYWVGVRLLMGKTQEFLFQFFTDDVEYLGQWKTHVAPECRGAHW